MAKRKIILSFIKPQPYHDSSVKKGRRIQQSGFTWLGQDIQVFETNTKNGWPRS